MNRMRYFQLMDGVDANTEIHQYMDLDYAIRIFETRSYFVKQKKLFQDKNESRLPLKVMFKMQPVGQGSNKDSQTNLTESLDRIRKFTESATMLTACWTERRGESALMWKNFTTKIGACIKSTISNFVASLTIDDYNICCGRMSYSGINSEQGLTDILFTKGSAYQEEKEIRFYFTPKNSLATCSNAYIPVLPDVMIDEIVLSPYIEPRAREVLRQMISEKYNLKVTSSKIELEI